MMGNIGPLEIGIVLIIALIVFGPKRLPELGNSLGKGIREFKSSISGKGTDGATATPDRLAESFDDRVPRWEERWDRELIECTASTPGFDGVLRSGRRALVAISSVWSVFKSRVVA